MEQRWVEVAGEENLDRVIGKIRSLPAMPWVVSKTIKIIEDPQSNAKDLAEVIATDQTMTARVLKMVNSAFYGYSEKVTTVSDAVVVLGFNQIRSLVISLSIFELFGNEKEKTALDRRGFWLHSISAAVCAQTLAAKRGGIDSEEAFVAGLLHDIGKAMLSEFTPAEYARCVKISQERNVSLSQAEKFVYGFDHAILGAWLGAKWEFPETLQRAIAYHHTPAALDPAEDAKAAALVPLVALSDAMSKICDLGFSGDQVLYEIPASLTSVGLNFPDCVQILKALPAQVAETAAMFGLADPSAGESQGAADLPGPADLEKMTEAAHLRPALVISEPGAISLSGLILERAGHRVIISTKAEQGVKDASDLRPEVMVWEGAAARTLPMFAPLFKDGTLNSSRKIVIVPAPSTGDASMKQLFTHLEGIGVHGVVLPAPLHEVESALTGETSTSYFAAHAM